MSSQKSSGFVWNFIEVKSKLLYFALKTKIILEHFENCLWWVFTKEVNL